MNQINNYKTLGLTNSCTFEEIKSQYKKLALHYHPDNKETGDTEKFKQIKEAYDNLKDMPSRYKDNDFSNDETVSEDMNIVKYYEVFMTMLKEEKTVLGTISRERVCDIASKAFDSYCLQKVELKLTVCALIDYENFYHRFKDRISLVKHEFYLLFEPHVCNLQYKPFKGTIYITFLATPAMTNRIFEWVSDLYESHNIGYNRKRY